MGMIPRIEIHSAPSTVPRFWPMQIGSARPISIDACRGVAWRCELSWDAAGHLLEVKHRIEPEAVHAREVYGWRGDELEGIRYFDAKVSDVFGDEPASQEVWTWEAGRPLEVRRPTEDGPAGPSDRWTWSSDGQSVSVEKSSDVGVLSTTHATFDAAGCLVRSEVVTGHKRVVVEATWSDAHTIVEARLRNMAAPDRVKTIGFLYDDAGRLVAQTSSNPPGGDEWLYRYDTP